MPKTSKQPGAYVIKHEASGLMYVGSTKDLKQRRANHESSLRLGKHQNPNLQKAYQEDNRIHFTALKTPNREIAYDLEQGMLDSSQGRNILFNKAPNARNAGIGQQGWIGKSHTEETKQKMSESAKVVKANLPEEEKERLRKLRVGIGHTPEMRKQLSESHKGKPSGAAIPVMIDGVRYASGLAAANALGINPATMKQRLNNPKATNYVKLKKENK